jgi:hypothetical protein
METVDKPIKCRCMHRWYACHNIVIIIIIIKSTYFLRLWLCVAFLVAIGVAQDGENVVDERGSVED